MIVRGVIGSVRWGYHRAADLRHWVVARDPATKAWTLRAQVVHADPFLGARSELHFVAQLKGGRGWQWPILELRMGAGALTARLAGERPILTGAGGVTLHRVGGVLVHG